MKLQKIIPVLASLALIPVAASADEPRPVRIASDLGDALPELTAEERALFTAGKADFEHEWTLDEGRGPLFNAKSCAACHGGPATGSGQIGTADNVHHFTIQHDGNTMLAFEFGGPVRERFSISGEPGAEGCDMQPEVDPTAPETHVSIRHTPPVFGFGLLDAVTDAEILQYEGAKKFKRPGVRGVSNWGTELEALGRGLFFSFDITRTQPIGASRINRFGWHAATATLFQFSTDPFNIELGVSTPFFPRENTNDGSKINAACKAISDTQPNDVNSQHSLNLYYFQALVSPPPRGKSTDQVERGEKLFNKVGCADCHRATLHTAPDYYLPLPNGAIHRVAALSNKEFHPYSDLLTHDMGPALADHRPQGRASGSFWRTTPLWGIRFKTNYLHDGSATTERDAIVRHAGEGQSSTDAFNQLSTADQEALIAFVESL